MIGLYATRSTMLPAFAGGIWNPYKLVKVLEKDPVIQAAANIDSKNPSKGSSTNVETYTHNLVFGLLSKSRLVEPGTIEGMSQVTLVDRFEQIHNHVLAGNLANVPELLNRSLRGRCLHGSTGKISLENFSLYPYGQLLMACQQEQEKGNTAVKISSRGFASSDDLDLFKSSFHTGRWTLNFENGKLFTVNGLGKAPIIPPDGLTHDYWDNA